MKLLVRFTSIYLPLTILLVVTIFVGCRKAEPVVLRLYCSETFWFVMQEEAKAFEQVYGIRTELVPIFPLKQVETKESKPKIPPSIPVGKLELDSEISILITMLSESRDGDIYLTDSSLEINQLKSFLLPTYEYPFCFLTMTLLVPKGNPMQLHSVQEVLEKKLHLGITIPTKDGSGIAASDIISKLSIANSSELVQLFGRQQELLQALEEKQIDAALVWDSTNLKMYLAMRYAEEYYAKYKTRFDAAKRKWNIGEMTKLIDEMYAELYTEKDFAEKIPLKKPPEDKSVDEHRVIQVSMISLSTTLHDMDVRLFADFLLSNQGQNILRKHGFIPKPF